MKPASLILLLALLAGSCKKANESYCCTSEDCGERQPCPEGLFCDNTGFYPASDGVGRTCIAPPGVPCSNTDPCEDEELSVCLDGVCVQCGDQGDCPAALPVCDEDGHICGACEVSDDCQAVADRPLCDDGACVGCRDGGDCLDATAPVCDVDDRACRGCVAGSECSSAVCDVAGGGCVAADDILYVEEDGTGDDCTAAAPCGTVGEAIALAAGTRIWIMVAPGTYDQTLAVTTGKVVRILGSGDGVVLRPGAIDQPAIYVAGGADLVIEGVTIRQASGEGSGPGDGIHCSNTGGSPTLVLRRVTVTENSDEGLDASNCTVVIERSTFLRNDGGALSLASCDFDVTNSFLMKNGDSAESGGVSISGNPLTGVSGARFEHNTVAQNVGPTGLESGIRCNEVTTPLGFANNIIYGNNDSAPAEVVGANCDHSTSLIGPVPEGDNLSDAPTYLDDGADDFHLAAESAGQDAAAPGDIAIDFDGEPRGAPADIGADEIAD